MNARLAKCVRCGQNYPLEILYTCPKCGGILDIQYDYNKVTELPGVPGHPGTRVGTSDAGNGSTIISQECDNRRNARFRELGSFQQTSTSRGLGIWEYSQLLPLEDLSHAVSLGEGQTPLIKCMKLGNHIGINNFYVKDETREPTGSFKDRPMAVAVSKARELRVETIVIASSGNAGASAAAYAARAGMRCFVFAPAVVPVGKLTQARMYGAKVVLVEGHYSNAYHLAFTVAKRRKWLNVTTTHLSPYPTEGDKTLAYEICEQMGWQVPDWVLIPIGAGPLLTGMYKGFAEYLNLGLIPTLPKLVGVQAVGCAPIVRAFEEGATTVRAWDAPKTVASGVSDPLVGYEQDGELTLERVRRSGGVAVSVTDEEILDAAVNLGNYEGIFSEPTGAVSVAGAAKLASRGIIRPSDTVVSVVTGAGLKETPVYTRIMGKLKAVPADITEVDGLIDSL